MNMNKKLIMNSLIAIAALQGMSLCAMMGFPLEGDQAISKELYNVGWDG